MQLYNFSIRIYSKLNIPRCQIWIFKKNCVKVITEEVAYDRITDYRRNYLGRPMGRQPWANLSRLEEAQSQGLGRPQALRCTTLHQLYPLFPPAHLSRWLTPFNETRFGTIQSQIWFYPCQHTTLQIQSTDSFTSCRKCWVLSCLLSRGWVVRPYYHWWALYPDCNSYQSVWNTTVQDITFHFQYSNQ